MTMRFILTVYINMTHTYLNQSMEGKHSVSCLGHAEIKHEASFNEQNLSFTKNMLLFEELIIPLYVHIKILLMGDT